MNPYPGAVISLPHAKGVSESALQIISEELVNLLACFSFHRGCRILKHVEEPVMPIKSEKYQKNFKISNYQICVLACLNVYVKVTLR